MVMPPVYSGTMSLSMMIQPLCLRVLSLSNTYPSIPLTPETLMPSLRFPHPEHQSIGASTTVDTSITDEAYLALLGTACSSFDRPFIAKRIQLSHQGDRPPLCRLQNNGSPLLQGRVFAGRLVLGLALERQSRLQMQPGRPSLHA